jgi:DNA-binding NarL/FixJ family response regulator
MSETRVLVVDDAPELRAIIAALVEMHDKGWHVVAEGKNGQQGIERAEQQQPDVVLLDISMPVMDGLEALPHIRAAAPRAVVIILSGFPSSAARDSAIAAGADGYIEKDSLVDTLMEQVEAVVRAARGSAAATAVPAGG